MEMETIFFKDFFEAPKMVLVEVPVIVEVKQVVKTSFFAAAWRGVKEAAKVVRGLEEVVFQSVGMERNLVTRGLFYGVGIYAGYKLCKIDVGFMAAGGKLYEKIRVKYSAVDIKTPTTTTEKKLESMRVGSDLKPMIDKKTQALVGLREGSDFTYMGSAHRIHDVLLMPEHVAASAADKKGVLWVKGVQGFGEINISDLVVIASDVVMYVGNAAWFSKVGLSNAPMESRIDQRRGLNVTIGAMSTGTMGKLTHNIDSFGMVIYDGSTTSGFSGAGYYSGDKLAGVHLHGGAVNGGYAISYLAICIKTALKTKNEDSASWLEGMFKKGAKPLIDYSHGDDVRILYQGQYHQVDKSDMDRAFGTDWHDIDDWNRTYGDEDYASTRTTMGKKRKMESVMPAPFLGTVPLPSMSPGGSSAVMASDHSQYQIAYNKMLELLNNTHNSKTKVAMLRSYVQENPLAGPSTAVRPNLSH